MAEEKSKKLKKHYLSIPEEIANFDDEQIDDLAESIYEQIIKVLKAGE